MLDAIIEWDKALFVSLNSMGNPSWDALWIFITKQSFFVVYPILLYLIFKAKGRDGFMILVFIAFTVLLCDRISVECFKEVFKRLRPDHTEGLGDQVRFLMNKAGKYSFVSSHATNVFGVATVLSAILGKYYKGLWIYLFVWASVVSYSRVYVGKHYPLDLVGGAILGLLIGLFVVRLYRFVMKRKAKKTIPNE